LAPRPDSAGRPDRAEGKTAFVGEYSIWASGQVAGAHVLLGFNNRGWAVRIGLPKSRHLISRRERSWWKQGFFYICIQQLKVLVLFFGIARI
jgi:hypothetical protein